MRLDLRTTSCGALALALVLAACSDDTTEPTPTLGAPTGVTVMATSATTTTVNWSAVTGATGYVVERAEGVGSTNFQQAGAVNSPPYNDSGLQGETTYRYRVRATSASASSENSSVVDVTTPEDVAPAVEITADITANTTWTANNVYRLKGFIHVANGATLTIQAGTRIEGDFDIVGSSLFVLRGARINAIGTADNPIVFTSSRPEGERQAGDWGGLILVGNGIINRGQPVFLEGTGTGAENPQVDYSGGNNNADNSGTLSYVRVEFAGYGTAPNQELNSFTFAAIGSGTTLNHLQSLNGLDDSFEFFGGAVDLRYIVSYNSGDDHFDASEGFIGRIQYGIAFQTRTVVPRPLAGNISSDPQGIENDGCDGANCLNGRLSEPFNIPMFANLTVVGPPATVTNSNGNIGMMLRRGTGGVYINNAVARWSRAGMSLRDQETLDRMAAQDLVLSNIYFAEVPVVCQPQTGATVQGCVDFNATNIQDDLATTMTSLFVGVPDAEPANGAVLDWTPAGGSAIATGGLDTFAAGPIADKAGAFVFPTLYRGAANPAGPKWWDGWTYFATN